MNHTAGYHSTHTVTCPKITGSAIEPFLKFEIGTWFTEEMVYALGKSAGRVVRRSQR
jgi:hypothetical protein